jgi:hypothetical protein
MTTENKCPHKVTRNLGFGTYCLTCGERVLVTTDTEFESQLTPNGEIKESASRP